VDSIVSYVNEMGEKSGEPGSRSPKPGWEEDVLFDREVIRDTAVHYSDISDVGEWDVFTIFVSNLHDQPVDIQVKAHRLSSTLGAVNVGAVFTVAKGDQDARTVALEEMCLPYVQVTARYATAQTRGDLTVFCLKKRKQPVGE